VADAKLEVVIPCYRDKTRLRFCIEGLARQEPLPELVRFTCDGGDRDIQEWLDRAVDDRFEYRFHYLEPETELRREGIALNLAFHYCRAERALILSDDMVLAPGVLKAHTEEAADDEALVGIRRKVALHSIPTLSPRKWTYGQLDALVWRQDSRIVPPDKFPGGKPLKNGRGFLGCHVSVPMPAVRKIGGFDAMYCGGGSRGDVDLGERLLASEVKLIARPDLFAYHLDHDPTSNKLSLVDRAEALMQTSARRRIRVRNCGPIETLKEDENPWWNQ